MKKSTALFVLSKENLKTLKNHRFSKKKKKKSIMILKSLDVIENMKLL